MAWSDSGLRYIEDYTGISGFIGGYVGRMENKMETTIVYWSYIGDYSSRFRVSGSKFGLDLEV